jgi:Ankyrin repeats (3 copies)
MNILQWSKFCSQVSLITIDPDEHDCEVLALAASYGHLSVVEVLLKNERVDPASDNDQAIRFAARDGHLSVVDVLLKNERVNPASHQIRCHSIGFSKRQFVHRRAPSQGRAS